jgi:hypothetical protein
MNTVGRALRADLAGRLLATKQDADGANDPRERVELAKHVADEIAALAARAREVGANDETILAQLQDAAGALCEGLT